jgi:DNA helicase II / ATP-dependent DNA helicase PcrA
MWTETQQAIISKPPSHSVVYAAPGSGKTAVLTAHCCHLFRTSMVNPADAFMMTFTRQSAAELKLRLLSAPGVPRKVAESANVGTFHAQVFRALLTYQPDIPVLLGPMEQRSILMSILAMEGMRHPRDLQSFQSAINRSKSAWPNHAVPSRYRKAAARYEKWKQDQRRWDFDDVLNAFCLVWEKNSDFASSFQSIQYVLVDEFQDINAIQWHIIQQFASFGARVFVVGDDDQSIYGFRGATPTWLLDFPHQFIPSNTYHLAMNFRSDQVIVQHATQLIQHNVQRMEKPFQCFSSTSGVCEAAHHLNEATEANAVCTSIQNAQRMNPDTTVAVLARTRIQLYHVWQYIRNAGLKNVQCRTYHDAKGKEFDVVHIVGAVARNPYLATQLQDADTEEERRLFYVAMTRARHALYVHVPRIVRGEKLLPVQFIDQAGL